MSQYLTLRKAKVTKKHYENFPVATLLFPKAHRDAATILYSFARNADDIADEGNLTKNERKKLLKEIEININSIKHQKKIQAPFFRDLDRVINQYSLDIKLFERFMSAFKQDVENKTYRNFNDLINYCNKAACPAGEMILSLFDAHNKKNVSYSNSLCQALALIGMTQDIYEDLLKGRVYIPSTEMNKFTLKESDIKIHLHINKHTCTISLDSSGDSLHKRGYKLDAVTAPMNEVLAAGLILLSGWDKKSNFHDSDALKLKL